MATSEKIFTQEGGTGYAHWATEATLERLVSSLSKQGVSQSDITALLKEVGNLNDNGKVDGWATDKNNNNILDAVYVDENEDKMIEIIMIDANENKSWDMIIFDADQDGQPNYRYIDRDDANTKKKWDAIEYDTDQDGKWDVIEEIPKPKS